MDENGKDAGISHTRAVWMRQLQDLLAAAGRRGLQFDPGTTEEVSAYCEFIHTHNARAGLISKKDLQGLVTKHVAASLGPLLLLEPKPDEAWLDFGTGGGIPGMIIKLARPEVDMTLLDSSRKKTIYLERFKAERQLQDLRVIEARISPKNNMLRGTVESSAQDLLRGSYDVILMRAVTSLRESFPLLENLSKSGTRFITYKGEEWETELNQARMVMNRLGWVFGHQIQVPWAAPKLLIFSRAVKPA